MKIPALTSVLLVFLLSSACTTTDSLLIVEGVVVDVDGRPLNNALVIIRGYASDQTRFDGRFCYEGLQPPDNISIEVVKEGFKSVNAIIVRDAYYAQAVLGASNVGGGSLKFESLPPQIVGDWYCKTKRDAWDRTDVTD